MYGSDGLGGVLNFLTPNPVADGNCDCKMAQQLIKRTMD